MHFSLQTHVAGLLWLLDSDTLGNAVLMRVGFLKAAMWMPPGSSFMLDQTGCADSSARDKPAATRDRAKALSLTVVLSGRAVRTHSVWLAKHSFHTVACLNAARSHAWDVLLWCRPFGWSICSAVTIYMARDGQRIAVNPILNSPAFRFSSGLSLYHFFREYAQNCDSWNQWPRSAGGKWIRCTCESS